MGVTNYKELKGAGYLYALWGEIECFLSQSLDTIEKEERKKMAKALRMEGENWGEGMIASRDYVKGYNETIQEFNKKIDNYLKKHE